MPSISKGLDNKVLSVTKVGSESKISDKVTAQHSGTEITDSYEPCASPLSGQTPNPFFVPEPKDPIKQDVAVRRSAEPVTWACLPGKVLSKIFSRLRLTDLESVALVNKQCAIAVEDDPKLDFRTRQLWQRLVQLRTEGADVAVIAKRVTDFLKGKSKKYEDPSVVENALIHRGLRLATIALNAVIDGAASESPGVNSGPCFHNIDYSLDTEENIILNLAHDVIADHIGKYLRESSARYRGWQSFVGAYEIGRDIGLNSGAFHFTPSSALSAQDAHCVVPLYSSASVIKILLCSVAEWSGDIDASAIESSIKKILSRPIQNTFFDMPDDDIALFSDGEDISDEVGIISYAPKDCSEEVNDIMAIKELFSDCEIAAASGEVLKSIDVTSLHAALFSASGKKLIAAYGAYNALFGDAQLARDFRIESYTHFRHKYYNRDYFFLDGEIGLLPTFRQTHKINPTS